MKILLASTTAEMFSGAVRCLLELADQLKKRQIEVVVVIPRHGDMEEYLKKGNIKYYCIHEYHSWYTSAAHRKNHFYIKRLLNWKAVLQMLYVIQIEKVDLVHVNSLTAYVAGWAASLGRKPLVWHIREFMEEGLGISFFDLSYSLKKLNQADQMIAISEPVKQKWEKIIEAPITVIYDGIPVENYYVQNKQKAEGKIRILIYGRIVPEKGQMFFFQGMNQMLKQTSRSVECYWAGTIEDREYYEKCYRYLEKNHLSDQVSYLGEIKDIKSLLAKTDIVCVCSYEGFGRVTIEAMLGQCLVLGADVGGTKDLIQHGVTGFLYKAGSVQSFADELTEIVEHYSEYGGIALKGQQYAKENFTVERNVNSIINVYQQLVRK